MAARELLLGAAHVNTMLLKAFPNIPPLLESGVRWNGEPWAGRGTEEIAPTDLVIRRGWGDCDDLIPWRVAELWMAGESDADIRVHWRPNRRVFHITTHRGARGGKVVEDTSRLLGM